MRIRNGVDLVRVCRLEEAYRRQKQAFLERIFTSSELEAARLGSGDYRWDSLAAGFAAKEAMAKALGTGISKEVHFTEIEVLHDEAGAPSYVLHGETSGYFTASGFSASTLSLSHEGDYAIAMCVIY